MFVYKNMVIRNNANSKYTTQEQIFVENIASLKPKQTSSWLVM